MKGKITIRISDSLKNKLSEMSETKEVSVSEAARTILENHFLENNHPDLIETQEFLEYNSIEDLKSENSTNQKYNESIFSEEFFKLVIWIYDQKELRILKLSNYEFESFKDYIIKIQSSNEIPKELKKEFDKVYVDLIKLINQKFQTYTRPNFAYGDSTGFNYDLLSHFLFPEKVIVNLPTL